LQPFLHRRVWATTLAEARRSTAPVFVKPSARTKRFTGLVLGGGDDWRIAGTPGREPVWCSDVVEWISEWRCYVIGSRLRYVAYCDGTRDAALDETVVLDAIARLAEDPNHPTAYAIDFGVLSTGETALIEMNDGFSIGAYDNVSPQIYLEMIEARWVQLVATAPVATN
jgi:hypothetical protein